MSAAPQPVRRGRAPRRRRRGGTLLRALAVLLAGLVLFALGVGVGQALREGPAPAGDVTRERTLEPLELPPAQQTVTVTVTS